VTLRLRLSRTRKGKGKKLEAEAWDFRGEEYRSEYVIANMHIQENCVEITRPGYGEWSI